MNTSTEENFNQSDQRTILQEELLKLRQAQQDFQRQSAEYAGRLRALDTAAKPLKKIHSNQTILLILNIVVALMLFIFWGLINLAIFIGHDSTMFDLTRQHESAIDHMNLASQAAMQEAADKNSNVHVLVDQILTALKSDGDTASNPNVSPGSTISDRNAYISSL